MTHTTHSSAEGAYWMFFVGPRMVIPRGVCWYAMVCKWSKMTSSTCVSTSCISRRITPRSTSIARSARVACWIMSARMSTAGGMGWGGSTYLNTPTH